jgi:hypothetical protein
LPIDACPAAIDLVHHVLRDLLGPVEGRQPFVHYTFVLHLHILLRIECLGKARDRLDTVKAFVADLYLAVRSLFGGDLDKPVGCFSSLLFSHTQ